MKTKIIFRADGNPEIGMGHFIRTLALAEILSDQFNCIYATRNPSIYQINEIERVCHERIDLSEDDSHSEEFLNHLRGNEIVVLDNYYFTTEYHRLIKKKGCRLVCLDDSRAIHYSCDVVINNIPGTDPEDIKRDHSTKVYCGVRYSFLRRDFLTYEWRLIPKCRGKVFISFGGSDPHNLSAKYVHFLDQMDKVFNIDLLVGNTFKHVKSLDTIERLSIHQNVSATKVAELISEAELCIVPASSLVNEVSVIGSKLLLGYHMDNQVVAYEFFVENKLAIGIGNFIRADFELFEGLVSKTLESEYLMQNQRSLYGLQQAENLKLIFSEL